MSKLFLTFLALSGASGASTVDSPVGEKMKRDVDAVYPTSTRGTTESSSYEFTDQEQGESMDMFFREGYREGAKMVHLKAHCKCMSEFYGSDEYEDQDIDGIDLLWGKSAEFQYTLSSQQKASFDSGFVAGFQELTESMERYGWHSKCLKYLQTGKTEDEMDGSLGEHLPESEVRPDKNVDEGLKPKVESTEEKLESVKKHYEELILFILIREAKARQFLIDEYEQELSAARKEIEKLKSFLDRKELTDSHSD